MPPRAPGISSGVLTVRFLWLTMKCCRYRYCNGLDNSSMKLAQWPNLLGVEVADVSTNTSKTPPAIGSSAKGHICGAESILSDLSKKLASRSHIHAGWVAAGSRPLGATYC